MPDARVNPPLLQLTLSYSTSCIRTRNLRRCSCHQGPFRRPHSPAEPTPLSLAWVATPQPPERSLSTPGPPKRTSNLKRALRRGLLWCSLASPSSRALTAPISVQGERRTAPPVTVRGRHPAPASASTADPGCSCPRYDAGVATPPQCPLCPKSSGQLQTEGRGRRCRRRTTTLP